MGRRREYESAAARQRAHRQRQSATWVRVEQRTWEQVHRRLEELQEAVRRAAVAGDGTARGCQSVSAETVVEKLIRHFEGEAERRRLDEEQKEVP
jgi:hypothetical protein